MMTGRRIIIIVAIIVLTGLACILILSKAGNVGVEAVNEKKITELCTQLSEQDVGIYVIGDMPYGLDRLGDKVTAVAPDSISGDNMPIWVSDIHSTFTDNHGLQLSESVPRDYPEHMIILVNLPQGTDMTDDGWQIVRDCAVENNVPVLLAGKDNINRFRTFLLEASKVCGDNDTMLFVSPDTWTMNPFEAAEDTTGKRFTVSFLEYMLGRIVEPDGD